jgi:hypothetical protein
MEENKCPLLGVKTVSFCKMYPTVMIPQDESSSSESICKGDDHMECSLFKKMNVPPAPGREGE